MTSDSRPTIELKEEDLEKARIQCNQLRNYHSLEALDEAQEAFIRGDIPGAIAGFQKVINGLYVDDPAKETARNLADQANTAHWEDGEEAKIDLTVTFK